MKASYLEKDFYDGADDIEGVNIHRYLLHHYFDVFQDGYRLYSPLFSEAIVTGALVEPADGMG